LRWNQPTSHPELEHEQEQRLMRVVIDTSKCVGHGQCAMMAPDVFDLDANGYSTLLVEDVSGDPLREAESAAAACQQAISMAE
jgi:ferredoxin